MKKIIILGFVLFCFINCGLKAEAIDVSARSAVLIEADSGRIIFQKNASERLAVASTTKIMTALITLEQANLDTGFIVDSNAIMVEGTSMGLKKGDSVTLRTLASGMLLASGNDAANASAVRIASTIPEFAILMNKRAQQIGMKDSNFVTPSGHDDQNHYSTALDMAKLARVALNNKNFRDICSQKTMKLSYGNPPYNRWLSNHNRLLKTYEGCIGVKTGFTKKAGRCLVSSAERDGVRLIAVTLKAPNDWQDHEKLLDYGFSQVETVTLPDISNVKISVVGGTSDKVTPIIESIPKSTISKEDLSKIKTQIIANPFLYAPIKEGECIGKVRYLLNGELLKEANLVAESSVELDNEVKKLSFFDKIKSFFR